MDVFFDQSEYELRCEWGISGLRALRPLADVIIIVDVLSFSTAVDIAVGKGAFVFPYRWKDDSAKRFAATKGALLAAKREAPGEYSLSPSSLCSIAPGTGIVLPSPNGSTLSVSASGVPTFTASLRNAPEVARRAALRGSRIAVIPAGERWDDDSMRPCLEDLLGAGAVLSALPGTRSPEVEVAVSAFSSARHCLAERLAGCSSGKELIEAGFSGDVALAAKHGVSSAAPFLVVDRFVNDSDYSGSAQ